jgi:adenine specific DNA methylase Mod
MTNRLYYGDNLDVLRQHVSSESVDLVYLDPPFNSNRAYNVLFAQHDVVSSPDQAQIQAFDDTWHWTPVTDEQYAEAISGSVPSRVADALTAMRTLLGENDAMAYLVNMAPRLVELHRVLKSTGSLYLHCDPTMSHYLKMMLDAVFGAAMFRNEIIWKRTGSHGSAKRYGPVHDTLLFYTKSDTYTWNQTYGAYEASYLEDKFSKRDEEGRCSKTSRLPALACALGRAVSRGVAITPRLPDGTGLCLVSS